MAQSNIAQFHETKVDEIIDIKFILARKEITFSQLSKNGVETKGAEILIDNKEQADELYEKVMNETADDAEDTQNQADKKHEKRLQGMIECINLYPGNRKYYNPIINDLYSADQVEFYEFVKYWKLDELFPNLTERRRIIC
jgi:hypothetical protein